MSKGFIPIKRSLFDHWLFNEKRVFSRFEAWLDLIQLSTFQENKTQIIKGKTITCKKGQVVASVRFLKDRWTWDSMNKVLSFLELLRSQDMLLIDKECGINRLTLKNYNKHNSLFENSEWNSKWNGQSVDSKGIQPNSGTANGTQNGTVMEQQWNSDGTNNNKDNKGKEVESMPTPIPALLQQSNLFRRPNSPKQEDVQRVFLQQGGTIEQADAFFKKYEAVEWYLNGSPIKRFETLVAGWIKNWNRNAGGGNHTQTKIVLR